MLVFCWRFFKCWNLTCAFYSPCCAFWRNSLHVKKRFFSAPDAALGFWRMLSKFDVSYSSPWCAEGSLMLFFITATECHPLAAYYLQAVWSIAKFKWFNWNSFVKAVSHHHSFTFFLPVDNKNPMLWSVWGCSCYFSHGSFVILQLARKLSSSTSLADAEELAIRKVTRSFSPNQMHSQWLLQLKLSLGNSCQA